MPVYETTFPVSASAEDVWRVLLDFDQWAEWNPSVPSISGGATKGSTLKLTLAMPGRPSAKVKATITELDPGRRLHWHGNVAGDGFFRGTRKFDLEPQPDGTTLVTHVEDVGGAFFPVFKLLMGSAIQKHHDNLNEALKARAER
ncbi:MAG TPA: SRPBCC domain-containing protein [Nocardioidaceae bacterium]|nr:SRPBCC domain-containing protein [Nocardioidaceae bacterium]